MTQGIPSEVLGLIGGLGNMQALKTPNKMFFCKIPQNNNAYCWGFLSPYDTERLNKCPVKVEVDIPTHQALISGGQIVYYNGELFNSDKYKLNENYDFILNTSYDDEQTAQRQLTFESQFFEIPAIGNVFEGGWYRKQPKGYSSAVESLNTCFNAVLSLGILPADTLIFYTQPDYANEEECTEEWLVAHQFRNKTMTKDEFMQFYSVFMTAWNETEH